ncbi:MAG: FtsW/RodA/SpoVE family cell cycle protein, partial [Defluviitaleaceae bacterium]|nr:FtsW/RodA/SpoVE family cell cycle protein [Defluviitaleaceae bacterium]
MIASRPTSRQRNRESSNSKTNTIYVGNLDYTFLICTIILVLFGILMVFSASYYQAFNNSNDRFRYLIQQSFAAILGAAVMLVLSNINYRYFKRFTTLIYIISIVLSILVLFIGAEHGGARRWILIPGFGSVQPSEVAKVALILKLSAVISSRKNMLSTLKGHMHALVIIGIPVALIAIENFSTALIVGIVGVGIVFVASPFTLVFFALAGSGVVAIVSYLAFFSAGFRGARFEAWLNPFAPEHSLATGFQTVQSLLAIGSGGLFGLGLGQSRQKLGFIPEAHNDIIFSVIVEELGIIGGGLLIFLFGVIIW